MDSLDPFLHSILAGCPTPAAQEMLLAHAREDGFDEGLVDALARFGTREAFDALRPLWSEGEPELAETLLTLAAIHGIDSADGAAWRADVEGARRTFDGPMTELEMDAWLLGLGPSSRRAPVPGSPADAHGISKKERKKRVAMRKRNRGR